MRRFFNLNFWQAVAANVMSAAIVGLVGVLIATLLGYFPVLGLIYLVLGIYPCVVVLLIPILGGDDAPKKVRAALGYPAILCLIALATLVVLSSIYHWPLRRGE
jgi:hypothetical protein